MAAEVMSDLSPEERIVLTYSCIGSDHFGSQPEVDSKQEGGFDSSKVLKLASMNLVLPFFFRTTAGVPGLPGPVMEAFKGAYYSTLRNNVLHAGETIRLLASLNDGGIEAIPLKGSIFSGIVFQDLGVYPTGDIDLLVRPRDLKKAERIICSLGYRRETSFREEDLLSDHYHLIFTNDEYFLELHWNLAKRYFRVPDDFWWDDTIKVEFDGTEVVQPAPEKYLLYAVSHLYQHGFRPLKFFLLISGLLHRYRNEIDWDRFIRYAARYRMKRLAFFTLKLLREFLNAPALPDNIARSEIPGYGILRGAVLRGLFSDVTRMHLKTLGYLFLLDGPRDFSRAVLGRIFPGSGEIRLRYGLAADSKLFYLYYALNPVLLLSRRRR